MALLPILPMVPMFPRILFCCSSSFFKFQFCRLICCDSLSSAKWFSSINPRLADSSTAARAARWTPKTFFFLIQPRFVHRCWLSPNVLSPECRSWRLVFPVVNFFSGWDFLPWSDQGSPSFVSFNPNHVVFFILVTEIESEVEMSVINNRYHWLLDNGGFLLHYYYLYHLALPIFH